MELYNVCFILLDSSFQVRGCVRMIKAPQQKSMNLCFGSKDMIVMWKVPS